MNPRLIFCGQFDFAMQLPKSYNIFLNSVKKLTVIGPPVAIGDVR